MKLAPADFWHLWPSIKERAMPYLRNVPGAEEELFAEIEDGRSSCWSNQEAVVVLSLVPAPGGKLDLFVRAAVTFKPTGEAVAHLAPDVRQIARDLGASSIRFRSERSGWIRSLGSEWRVAHVEYVTETTA